MTLKISVIIPLLDHRSHALECVQSWAQAQTFARDSYEVIVVSAETDRQLADQIKAKLAAHDKFILASSGNEFEFYNYGAAQATGELLFITESHCLGMPECLSEAVKFLTTLPYAGACCGSVNSTENRFAYMEDRMVAEVLQPRLDNEHWYRVTVRGFAIWRQIYQVSGGFESEFGHFAEPALSARLHSQGHSLGYASQAMVYHYNTTSLAEIRHLANEYTVGECEYRLKYPVEYCEFYFGHAPEWAIREAYQPVTAQRFRKTLLKSLLTSLKSADPPGMCAAQFNALCYYGLIGLLGVGWPLWRARLALWLAQLRLVIWYFNRERAYRAYGDFWAGIAHYSRLEFISRHWLSQAACWQAMDVYDLTQIEDSRLTGFHAIESWQEQNFRWSGPVAMVQVTLLAQAYQVRLELLPVGLQERPLYSRIYFNGHEISTALIKMCDNGMLFSLNLAMFTPKVQHQQLVLICNPLQTGNLETRHLGLPVKGIYFIAHDSNLSD